MSETGPAVSERLASVHARARAAFDDIDTIDIVTRLTLVLLLVSDWVVGQYWQYSLPLRILGLAGLLAPPLNRDRRLWAVIMAFMTAKCIDGWWVQDNHHFLLTYWCLGLTMSLFTSAPMRQFQVSARLLVGLTFAFASLWKGWLSPDFIDGSYFHYTFLTDRRFEAVAAILGGVPDDAVNRNWNEMAKLAAIGPDAVSTTTLLSTTRLRVMTFVITQWTMLVELAMSITFLWPREGILRRLRHIPLLVFAWTTYTTVTNVGVSFGWTLMICGAAQCSEDEKLARALYVLTCPILLVYHYAPLMETAKSILLG